MLGINNSVDTEYSLFDSVIVSLRKMLFIDEDVKR